MKSVSGVLRSRRILLAFCLLAFLWPWAGTGRAIASDEPQLDPPAVPVLMDVMPGTCPHTLTDGNMLVYECRDGADPHAEVGAFRPGPGPKCGWQPVRVAIVVLGGPEFDASRVDPGSICLSGGTCKSCVSGTVLDGWGLPACTTGPFPCCSQGPDGYPDFCFTVHKCCLWNACAKVGSSDEVVLVMKGRLKDGTRFAGSDVVALRRTNPVSALERPGPPIVSLSEGRPNPFNPSTSFAIEFSEHTEYVMEVYDVIGRRVYSESGFAESGTHTLVWDGRSREDQPVASGVYFLQVTAGAATAHRKVMLLK